MSVEVAFAKRDSRGNMRRSVLVFSTYLQGATAAAALWNTFHDEFGRGYLMKEPEEFMLNRNTEHLVMTDWHKDFYVEVGKCLQRAEPLQDDPQYA